MNRENVSKIISVTDRGAALNIRVQPNASKNKISGLYADRLKVVLSVPPVEGKANRELYRFLSKTLSVSKSSLEIISGLKARNKVILFKGVDRNDLLDKLIHHVFL